MPKVTIRCEQIVVYRKTVNMPDEAFANYTAAVDRDEKEAWFSDFVDLYIDPMNDAEFDASYDDVEVELAPLPMIGEKS